MMIKNLSLTFSIIFTFLTLSTSAQQEFDVVIIGGGASGTMAAIQASREGVKVCLIEQGPWLGGMLTSAGVSAIDGNHKLAGGLWREFRQHLYDHYGGADKVNTGWVSNTLFEPHVGDSILKKMVYNEKNISLILNATYLTAKYVNKSWIVGFKKAETIREIRGILLMDATELGDVYGSLSKNYNIGMEANSLYNESFTISKSNNIIQDLTYVMILKDYGKYADKTIARPATYRKEDFLCACDTSDPATKHGPKMDCKKMMTYGKLPNDKYMINWPNCGNDFYTNIIELNATNQEKEIINAKNHSLCFLYFLQTELGLKHLGLADDVFPTGDRLPLIPYHRESRRIKGVARLIVDDLINPYSRKNEYYKTGIAVGDYPIDHHHKKNSNTPAIDFINIKISSYNIPLGSMIPLDLKNFIVAEKSISVSNIVNGATRLQPVVIGIGQAAGALAAEAVISQKELSNINIRNVQNRLLSSSAYLLPYIDVNPDDPDFRAIQKIGATGILKGKGIAYKWANQTWFYPESLVTEYELLEGMRPYYQKLKNNYSYSGEYLNLSRFIQLLNDVQLKPDEKEIKSFINLDDNDKLSRRAVCKLLDRFVKPFEVNINFEGKIKY